MVWLGCQVPLEKEPDDGMVTLPLKGDA